MISYIPILLINIYAIQRWYPSAGDSCCLYCGPCLELGGRCDHCSRSIKSYRWLNLSATAWWDHELPVLYMLGQFIHFFPDLPTKTAAIALLMGQTLIFRKFAYTGILVGCQTFLRNTASRRKIVFQALQLS